MVLITPGQLLQLVLVAFLLAAGQVLFKYGATQAPTVTGLGALLRLMLSPPILAALVLYGCTTLLWVLVLQQVPLSLAYPFMALGFLLVPLAGVAVFGESVGLRYLIGLVLILAGLWFVVSR
jgi:multidrug transporter EmrE-like cation transporter